MVSNGTVFFTFVGLIIFFIGYKLTPFLNYKFTSNVKQNLRVSNPSVLDDLLQSTHKYEVSDCFTADIQCKSNDECRLICTENLNLHCDKICKLKDSNDELLCENGVIKIFYDFSNGNSKKVCVCNSPLYHGPSCTNTIAHCDTIKDNTCFCNSYNTHFMWYIEGGVYDICIPKIDYKLFSHQDNFKTVV